MVAGKGSGQESQRLTSTVQGVVRKLYVNMKCYDDFIFYYYLFEFLMKLRDELRRSITT